LRTSRHTAQARIEGDIDLIGVNIGTRREQRLPPEHFVWPQILRVPTLLQARIMLLDAIAVYRIVQKKREIRIQIKQRPRGKSVRFKHIAVRAFLAEINGRCGRAHAPAVARIDRSEPVQPAGGDFIERNLTRRIEPVQSAIESKPEFTAIIEAARIIRRHVITAIAQWTHERTVGAIPFVGKK
jgi:hypothetical protein